jgi:hypothetical protein
MVRLRFVAVVSTLVLGCTNSSDMPFDPDGGGMSPDAGSTGNADGGTGSGSDGGDGMGSGDGGSSVQPGECEALTDFQPGEPMEAPAKDWTWVGFPESRCMDGSSTGIGVNLNPDSDKVMIYLQPGGACFDTFSCQTVANPDGFGQSDLESLAQGYGSSGIFNREDETNPVRNWNFIFVPYCTGDIHAGTNPDGPQGRMHVGFLNMRKYLTRIVATFDEPSKVLLTGSSAGGFGSAYNFDQVQRAFGCDIPVHLVDDAGPPMSNMYMKPCLQQNWRNTWGLDASLPEDCPACFGDEGGGIVNYTTYLARKYPDRRLGILSTTRDSVIRQFYSYGYSSSCQFPANMPGEDFRAGLMELRDDILGPHDHFELFQVEGSFHTFLGSKLSDHQVGDTNLAQWIDGLLNGSSDWQDVGP